MVNLVRTYAASPLRVSLFQSDVALVCSVSFFPPHLVRNRTNLHLKHDTRNQYVLYSEILCLVLDKFGQFILQQSLKMGPGSITV